MSIREEMRLIIAKHFNQCELAWKAHKSEEIIVCPDLLNELKELLTNKK